MPGTLKETYLAKSVKDLQDIANIPPNTKPNQLVKSAQTIFVTAGKEQENGDEEKAYVSFTKYCSNAKSTGLLSGAVRRLKALERSLEARYQSKADEEMAKNLDQRIEQTEPRIPECSTCSEKIATLEGSLRRAEDELKTLKRIPECTTCLEPRTRTYILLPCGHATFCQECAEHLCNSDDKRCPICRTRITGKNRVFQ